MPKTERWQWYVEQFAPTEQHHHAIDRLYYAGRSQFQEIGIIDTPVFGKMLILDGDTQSSQADERIYHEALVHPAMAGATDRSEVLILGGGEGATLREVLRHPAVRRATMVDIDGEVIELSKMYLACLLYTSYQFWIVVYRIEASSSAMSSTTALCSELVENFGAVHPSM